MKLTRTHETPQAASGDATGTSGIDRRTFLRYSGYAAGGTALASAMSPSMVKKAEAATPAAGGKADVKRTICTHCSVGCGIYAEGPARSRPLITRSTAARTAPRARRCASTATVSGASSTR
jgi:anaerobic selenocysteine-containing dehydrogenase